MARKSRYSGALEAFASASTSGERTVFGGVTASDAINDQITAEFLRGWGIVGVNDLPTKQDFNAMGYTFGYLLAYLYQSGVPEWNSAQDYHTGNMVNVSGVLYQSLQNNNTNKNPASEPTWWSLVVPVKADQTETDAGSLDTKFVTPLRLRNGYAATVAANGYFKLPSFLGGWIFQWGAATTTGGGSVSVSFPITFPNNAFRVFMALQSGSPINAFHSFNTLTLSGCSFFTNAPSGAVQLGTINYLVIGR